MELNAPVTTSIALHHFTAWARYEEVSRRQQSNDITKQRKAVFREALAMKRLKQRGLFLLLSFAHAHWRQRVFGRCLFLFQLVVWGHLCSQPASPSRSTTDDKESSRRDMLLWHVFGVLGCIFGGRAVPFTARTNPSRPAPGVARPSVSSFPHGSGGEVAAACTFVFPQRKTGPPWSVGGTSSFMCSLFLRIHVRDSISFNPTHPCLPPFSSREIS